MASRRANASKPSCDTLPERGFTEQQITPASRSGKGEVVWGPSRGFGSRGHENNSVSSGSFCKATQRLRSFNCRPCVVLPGVRMVETQLSPHQATSFTIKPDLSTPEVPSLSRSLSLVVFSCLRTFLSDVAVRPLLYRYHPLRISAAFQVCFSV